MELEQLLHHAETQNYNTELHTCAEKYDYWRNNGLRDRADRLGIIKTVLFTSRRDRKDQYLLASTLAEKQVNLNELRVELGLSGAEAQSLHTKIDDPTIEAVIGMKRGAISPFVSDDKKSGVTMYITRDLVKDLCANPEKKYDLPLSLTRSALVVASELYLFLAGDDRYRLPGECEELPLEVKQWRRKKIDTEKAGYSYLFVGTKVQYRGQEYELKNPRLKKEGVDRRRTEIGCLALPITRKDGKIEYEMTERGRKRVMLPVDYETLEDIYLKSFSFQHLFEMRNKRV